MKEYYIADRKIDVQSWDTARLWKDPLKDKIPLAGKFPQLFSICNYQDCTINKCLEADSTSLSRRRPNPDLSEQSNCVMELAKRLCISIDGDVVRWPLGPKCCFITMFIIFWRKTYLIVTIAGYGKRNFLLKFRFFCGNFSWMRV